MVNYQGAAIEIDPTGSAKITIHAPTGETSRVSVITAGEHGDTKCNVGVVDSGQSGSTENSAIRKRAGGEIQGPWLINDNVGLVIENRSSQKVVCSYMGEVI